MISDEMVEAAHDELRHVLDYGEGFSTCIAAIRAALEAAEKAAWRPISEAPKDEFSDFIVALPDGSVTAAWFDSDDGEWFKSLDPHPYDSNLIKPSPTHFRPLPPPPGEGT